MKFLEKENETHPIAVYLHNSCFKNFQCYMLNKWGIKANPKKIQDFLNMIIPKEA